MSGRGADLSASLRCLDRVDQVLRRKRLWKIRHAPGAQRSAARSSSSRAVMNMTGGEIPAAFNFSFSSMPEAPFRLISRTRHVAARRLARSMKLSIVWKVSTSNPRALRSRSTAPKTLRSSSRTWISLR